MDRSIITRMKRRPRLLALHIIALTLVIVVLNGYGLTIGVSNLLPHLFYLPIILEAYFFPRRGVLFAGAVSLVYLIMTLIIESPTPLDIFLALGRIVMFVIIAAVVSLLTLRLEESERQFRGVAERSSDIIFLTDAQMRTTYVSPSFGKVLGMDAQAIVDKRPEDFVHPDDMALLYKSFAALVKGEPVVQLTVRTRKKDGKYISIEYLCSPIFSNGTFSGAQVIGRDVTERRMIEDAYRETSHRMAGIIDFLPDPTMVVNREGNIVAWNQAMEEISGIRTVDVLGKGADVYTSWIRESYRPILIEYVLKKDIEGIKKTYRHVHFAGNTVRTETEIFRMDGTRLALWVSATPLFDKEGMITGAIESLRDVTHQKKIEHALKESTTYLDAVINTMADPLFIKDRDHRFVKVNDSFCQFTGHPREDLLGKTDADFFRSEEAEIYIRKDDEVFRTGIENENEETLTDVRGVAHTIVTKKTLYTNSAKEKFIVGVIRDITERKKTEQALQLAFKKLNMLSSITRHDILNQLMSLRAFLQLTKERENDPEVLEFLMKGERAAEAIQRQIEFTRNYESLGATEPQWQDIGSLFRSAVASLPLSGITIDLNVPGVSVYADPLIVKVFYNLVENSLRHGGAITSISLSSAGNADGIIITYRDNGVGIPIAEKKYIFQKGFGKNTGLGLFLSREILSITGITITENGEPGSGARFEIHVPNGAYRNSGPGSEPGI